MAGFDDPRFLEQEFKKLEKKVEDLRKATLPLTSVQRGPIPGWLRSGIIEASEIRASTINAALIQGPQPVSGPFMSLDMTGAVAGTRPLLIVNDGTVRRVEIGNLAANGVSPAHYGFRVNSPAGSPTVDTFGAISGGVMSSFGIIDVFTQNFTATAFADVTGSAINFTVPTPPGRAVNLLTLFLVTGTISSETAGNAGFVRAVLDGTPVSGNLNIGTAGAVTCTGWVFSPAVSAAAHTMKLQGAVNQAGPTFAMIEAAMQVFQLGS